MDNVLEVSLLQCEANYVIVLTDYSVVSLFIRLRYFKFIRIALTFCDVCLCVSVGVVRMTSIEVVSVRPWGKDWKVLKYVKFCNF